MACELSPAEADAFHKWATEDPERGRAVEALAADWTTPVGAPPFDATRTWAGVAERIGRPSVARVPGRRAWRSRGIGLAAGLAATVAAGVVIDLALRTPSQQPIREFTTTAGNRATITLRDGTRLVLAPATRLRVPVDFGRSARMVELDGEAWFAVVHDERRPFAVRARNATVTDVGTEFDVRAYASDAAVRVAVVEGQVCLGAPTRHCQRPLQVGDVATIRDAGTVVRHAADVSALTAWTQGRLVFEDTPLGDVARELARAFDLTITVADTGLARKPITATFGDQPVDVILDDITDVAGARYERVGRAVVIRRRAASAGRHNSGPRDPVITADATSTHDNERHSEP